MFWSKLCKSSWNCAWNLAFPVFISPIVWNMCENLHYESVYFKELHNQQEYCWPTIYRTGAAVVSTITSLCYNYGGRRGSRINTDRFPKRDLAGGPGAYTPWNLDFYSLKSPFLCFWLIQSGYWPDFNMESLFMKNLLLYENPDRFS